MCCQPICSNLNGWNTSFQFLLGSLSSVKLNFSPICVHLLVFRYKQSNFIGNWKFSCRCNIKNKFYIAPLNILKKEEVHSDLRFLRAIHQREMWKSHESSDSSWFYLHFNRFLARLGTDTVQSYPNTGGESLV
ncbi:hypothetical protein RJT34_16957 [Clitoria ternatea]|uniref:Uncharacterized protein n=1 Tax=Clitoria ternatea TaxID=43366 RepID=A0AAN9J9A6_CLITE